MPLALLGLVAIGIGVGLSVPGLAVLGGWWTLLGVVIWRHGRRIDAARASNVERAGGGAVVTEGVVTDRRWALGLALVAGSVLLTFLTVKAGPGDDDDAPAATAPEPATATV